MCELPTRISLNLIQILSQSNLSMNYLNLIKFLIGFIRPKLFDPIIQSINWRGLGLKIHKESIMQNQMHTKHLSHIKNKNILTEVNL